MNRLRRIAVFVEEVGAGNFHWVLIEQGDDASEWIELYASPMAYDLWLDAFEDGCAELLRLVPDERMGPRAAGEDEDAPPVGLRHEAGSHARNEGLERLEKEYPMTQPGIAGSGDGTRPTTSGGVDNIGGGERLSSQRTAAGEDISSPAPEERMQEKRKNVENTKHDDSSAFGLNEDLAQQPNPGPGRRGTP